MAWCLLLSGLPNSGKSTIAYHLVQSRLRNVLVIDGDKHREAQFLGRTLGFSREDIMENNLHVIKLARFAQDQAINVIIAQIAPYIEQRQLMRRELDGFYEVFCDCKEEVRSNRPNFRLSELVYEEGGCDLFISTDAESIEETVSFILLNWFDKLK